MAGIAQELKLLRISNNGGSSSNIAQGVTLAAMSGSDILSMSLGVMERSLALENALQYAYGFSFLVASAEMMGFVFEPMDKCVQMAISVTLSGRLQLRS